MFSNSVHASAFFLETVAEFAHAQKHWRVILDSWRGISPVGQPRDRPVADFGSVAAAIDTSPGAVQTAEAQATAGQHDRRFEFDWKSSSTASTEQSGGAVLRHYQKH
jgi:hypothetical protein